jgi:hypothetical protein
MGSKTMARKEAGQIGGPLGMPGRQQELESRVGAQKFLIGVCDHFLFPEVGGGRQPYRPPGLRRSVLGTMEPSVKIPQPGIIPSLQEPIVLQIASEMQSCGGNSQSLKAVKIRVRARSDNVI